MAELSTLARPYAKAAFDFANENNVVEQWDDFLIVASELVSNQTFSQLLDNPAIQAEKKAETLIDLYDAQIATEEESILKTLIGKLSGKTSKASPQLKNFVQQLAEQERLSLIPNIYKHYRNHKSKALKQVDAYVTTAYPLDESQRVLLQSRLAASLNATVILHEEVDTSLLAGASIKIGDRVVEDSVRGKLKQLKTQLTA